MQLPVLRGLDHCGLPCFVNFKNNLAYAPSSVFCVLCLIWKLNQSAGANKLWTACVCACLSSSQESWERCTKNKWKRKRKKIVQIWWRMWRLSEHAHTHTHTNPQPNIQLWCTNTHHIKGEKRVLLPSKQKISNWKYKIKEIMEKRIAIVRYFEWLSVSRCGVSFKGPIF